MNDDRSRKEYVLNATGGVYYGTAKQIASMPWNFGQVRWDYSENLHSLSLLIL